MNKSLASSSPFVLSNYCPPGRNILILALAIASAAFISTHLVTPITHIAILSLSSGISLGLLLTSPRRYWALYLLTAYAASATVAIGEGFDPRLVACLGIANMIEVLIAASIMYWPDKPSHHFTDKESAIRMAIGCTLAPGMSMLVACAARYALQGMPILATAQVWYFAHVLGLSIVTPLTLTMLFRDFEPFIRPKKLLRTIVVLLLLDMVLVAVFGQTQFPILFLVFPFLALVVFQLGFPGMTIALFMIGVSVSYYTISGTGPFMLMKDSSFGQRVLMAQFFIGTCVAMALPIATALAERMRLERGLLTAQEQLRQMAATDQLTGIANRRMFDEFIDREWKRALRDKTTLCAIMIDVDCFKLYNDRYGHQAGDDCLKAVALSLLDVVRRPGDLVARYGGEEFVALLPTTDLTGARFVAEQIRRRVEALQIVHSGTSDGRVTISLGVDVALPSAGGSPEDLIASADALLYSAKEKGRNCVCDGGNAPLKKHVRA